MERYQGVVVVGAVVGVVAAVVTAGLKF